MVLIWNLLFTLVTKKGILILGKGVTQGLDDTTLTPEVEYSILLTMKKSTLPRKHQLFVDGLIIYQLKAKDSELFAYLL